MKSLTINGLRVSIALVVGLFIPIGLWAGEAIQFSNTKNHLDPNQKPALPGAGAGSELKLGNYGALDRFAPRPFQAGRHDPRAARKAQNAEDERRNWMVLEPGQLDAEDEEDSKFGIKEYDLDKKDSKRNYFFTTSESKADRIGRPREQGARAAGKKRGPPESSAKEPSGNSAQDDKDAKDGQPVSKDGRPLGDHVSKALDMKDLLSPGKANSIAPVEDSTTKLWREVLGGAAMADSRVEGPSQRGDGSVADGFRPSISGEIRAPGSTPSISLRSDFGSPPAGGSPGLSRSASAISTPPPAPLAPRLPDSFANRPAAPSSVNRSLTPNDSYGSRPGGFRPNFGNSPYGQQPPPRRPPSSGFEIPARPGYGGQ